MHRGNLGSFLLAIRQKEMRLKDPHGIKSACGSESIQRCLRVPECRKKVI